MLRRSLLAATALPFVARAQGAFPNRPIRVIAPFAPGGIVDVLARLLADRMARSIGQPVVVENRPGAGGNVGTALVARARGDAHVLLIGSSGPLAVSPTTEANLPYDPLTDLTPISLIGGTPLVLVVPAASPARDVPGLIALLKAEGREILWPTPGVGSPGLLAGEAFRQAAGFPASPVHYPGSPQVVLSVINREFPFCIENPLLVLPHIQAGTLRAIATTAPAPAGMFPDVPLISATLPSVSASGWYAVLAPAGIGAEAQAKLAAETVAALRDPDVTARLTAMAMTVAASDPAALTAHIVAETARWRGVLAGAGK
ncbi:Bug family tripartite tricarboxylate transporter substrate binding protein [Humitalea sp. 24SJ18S-53]|uniref:Bug family tripartite tricarboxylate transporter substrate binding protein n=1 Tax=Humitalea sp. 24SJ18S-53 TaxID=3422307 RepID=UPI003D67AB22